GRQGAVARVARPGDAPAPFRRAGWLARPGHGGPGSPRDTVTEAVAAGPAVRTDRRTARPGVRRHAPSARRRTGAVRRTRARTAAAGRVRPAPGAAGPRTRRDGPAFRTRHCRRTAAR